MTDTTRPQNNYADEPAKETTNGANGQTALNTPLPKRKMRSASAVTKRNRDIIHRKGFSFDTMLEQSYPKNVYNGNKPMRGYDTHDKRFENFNPEPECSTKVKNTYLPHWIHSDPDQSKTMNFDLPSYCMNMY